MSTGFLSSMTALDIIDIAEAQLGKMITGPLVIATPLQEVIGSVSVRKR